MLLSFYYPLIAGLSRIQPARSAWQNFNKTINWQPESTGIGRFGNWLENLNDWNLHVPAFGVPTLSGVMRNRVCGEKCIGSVLRNFHAEIEKPVAAGYYAEQPIEGEWFRSWRLQSGESMIRLTSTVHTLTRLYWLTRRQANVWSDLIDVWSDSGHAYAQLHYHLRERWHVAQRQTAHAPIHSTSMRICYSS